MQFLQADVRFVALVHGPPFLTPLLVPGATGQGCAPQCTCRWIKAVGSRARQASEERESARLFVEPPKVPLCSCAFALADLCPLVATAHP